MAKTNFNDVVVDILTSGGRVVGVTAIAKAADYALTAAERSCELVKCEMTAASKVLTLGMAENQLVLVKNVGATNAFTVKNISGDTGTSLAAGKSVLLIAGGATANTNTVIALD